MSKGIYDGAGKMVGIVSVSTEKSVLQNLLDSTKNEKYPLCYLVFEDYDGTNLDQTPILPESSQEN